MGRVTQLGKMGLALLMLVMGCATPTVNQGPPAPGGQAPSVAPSAPKRLVAAIATDPPQLTRVLGLESARGGDALQNLVQVGFAVEDERGTLQPKLARELPSLENGLWRVFPDGRMETTFNIRENALWHDST